MERYTPVEEAVRATLGGIPARRPTEWVPLKSAFRRVSARDVAASGDLPLFDSSHMDGFALRHSDLSEGVGLRIRGELGPGQRTPRILGSGEAYRVATGSFLPPGADTVLPAEEARVRGTTVRASAPPEKGQFVYPAGADVRRGEVVLGAGKTIRAQDVGLLTSLGVRRAEVFKRPKLTIIATGTELTDSARPARGKVRNSHVPIFMRMAEELGCDSLYGGLVPDERGRVLAALRRSLARSDIVLTTGGTSVGRHDLVGEAVSGLSPRTYYHGIRMDRGRVAGVALVGGRPIVLMPGPVQGAANAFALLALPLIRRLSGRAEDEVTVTARLGRRWEARRRFPDFTKVMYVKLRRTPDGHAADPVVADTESMTVLTRADAFVVVPEEVTSIEAGERVSALLLPGFSY